jgi:hypothetical protein
LGALVDLSNGTRAAAGQNNSRACSQANQAPGCVFEDELFRDRIVGAIAAHDASAPLFAFIAWHGVHVPLEAPQAYVDRFSFINVTARALYAAKVAHSKYPARALKNGAPQHAPPHSSNPQTPPQPSPNSGRHDGRRGCRAARGGIVGEHADRAVVRF